MDIQNSLKLKSLLQGRILVKEIDAENPFERTWIEIQLNRSVQPDYPLKTPPYAMLSGSKFQPLCPPELASFRLRYATFPRDDIENGFDPNYDKVGNYIDIPSVAALDEFLKNKNFDFETFVDSAVTDCPM